MWIGCHLSAADGFRGLARDAIAVGANVFQFFTRNPRGGAAKPIDPADVADFLATAKELSFGPILAHAPYTLNACSANEDTRRFAREVFADDLARMEAVPGNLYNFHPGSHVGQGAAAGIALIAETLDAVLRPEQSTTVLLETMSGKGSEVGGRLTRATSGTRATTSRATWTASCARSTAPSGSTASARSTSTTARTRSAPARTATRASARAASASRRSCGS